MIIYFSEKRLRNTIRHMDAVKATVMRREQRCGPAIIQRAIYGVIIHYCSRQAYQFDLNGFSESIKEGLVIDITKDRH